MSGTNSNSGQVLADRLRSILDAYSTWVRCGGQAGERAELSGAYLSRVDLSGVDLSGANLTRAYLSGANLKGADLSRANLTRANFSSADLTRADLSGADLSGANLWGANLSGADLSGADLSWAKLSGADSSGAELSTANLYGANLVDGALSGAYRVRENHPERVVFARKIDRDRLPFPRDIKAAKDQFSAEFLAGSVERQRYPNLVGVGVGRRVNAYFSEVLTGK